MDPVLGDLLKLMQLRRIDENVFEGDSHDIGTPQVFGGQVLGQALAAAGQTVDGRATHSIHAYFLRRGDVSEPITYTVDRARDGGSFSNRRVVASQRGKPIFNMAASFQVHEPGLEHQLPMPDVPGPDGLRDRGDIEPEVLAQFHEKMRAYLTRKRPFHVRPLHRTNLLKPEKMDPVKYVWIKAVDKLPDDPLLHQVLFTYVSDYELLGTATLPHEIVFTDANVKMASLDHAVWFHRPFRVDEWLLLAFDSPAAAGARGLARGTVYTRNGQLVASGAQEGLIRVGPPRRQ